MNLQWTIAILAGSFAATAAAAQVPAIDISAGAASGRFRVAASAWRQVLAPVPRLALGLGARITGYGGDPAAYINRSTVSAGLPATLPIDPSVFALALAGFAEIAVAGQFRVGANLDVIGVAAGPTRTSGALRPKPQAFSYFLYGSRDRGALNSEFYASLRIAPRLVLRAGMSHYVTNYEVTGAGASGSPEARYQRFETVPFVALSLRR